MKRESLESITDLSRIFDVSRATIYRALAATTVEPLSGYPGRSACTQTKV